jgi:hypothetical protein
VSKDIEVATQKILAAAEDIDQAADQPRCRVQGRDRPRARPGHPGPRRADFRGLQFPGPHQPARD